MTTKDEQLIAECGLLTACLQTLVIEPGGFGGAAARDFEDLFSGGAFGDLFGSFFGGGGRRDSTPRGSDLRYDLEIDFADAVFGSKIELSYARSAKSISRS